MKTYQTSVNIPVHQLYTALNPALSEQFSDKIKRPATLQIIEKANSIEIGLGAPYEDYLYKIDVEGTNLSISKSEHYTDDVNSLAMEDILTDLVLNFIGDNLVSLTPSSN